MRRLIAIGILFGLASAMQTPATVAQASDAKQKPADISTAPAIALDPQLLEHVQLVGSWRTMTAEESEAYYSVLAHARDVDERQLRAAARQFQNQRRAAYPRLLKNPDIEFPAFVDLFENPKLYHGKPVTLKGHVRRFVVHEDIADENEQGIQTLYEAWLFTDDSQGHPVAIVCTSIPDGFPRNEELIDHVSATGYFFKRLVYEAQDDKHRLVPLILAHRLQWRPPKDNSFVGPAPSAVYLGAAAVFVVIILLLWRSARKDRAYRQSRVSRSPETAGPDFTALDPAGETTTLDSASVEGSDISVDNDGAAPVDPSTTADPQTDPAGNRPSS